LLSDGRATILVTLQPASISPAASRLAAIAAPPRVSMSESITTCIWRRT
jgi:hypothetical protein